jgi:hypothetical protein
MDRIINWFKQNKTGSSILAGGAAFAIFLAAMNGCQLTDLIGVEVPEDVQKATESPKEVTLTEAPAIMEEYLQAGERFKANIDDGYRRFGMLSSVTNVGLSVGSTAIPGGAGILGLVTFLGGLFIKGPGTNKEKNASYNKGLEEGQRIATQAIGAIKGVTG